MRAAAAANSPTHNTDEEKAPTTNGEGGSQTSLTELVQEQVAAIRSQLEAELQVKIQQEETKYKDRADNLKKQLNTKLKESRETIRLELSKEHHETLESLRAEKDAEIERIKSQHQDEMQHMKTESDAAIQEAKRLANESLPTATAAGGATPTTPSKLPEGWSEHEIKDFISKNPTVKHLVSRNVLAKLNQEKEALSKKMQGEQESVIQEQVEARAQELKTEQEKITQEKVEAAKKMATDMESKRQAVKLGMQEKKAALATSKLDVVEKAAQETPERAVNEVWAIAKVVQMAKPQTQSANQNSTLAQTRGQANEGTNAAASTETDAVKQDLWSTSSLIAEGPTSTEMISSQLPQPDTQDQLQIQNAAPPGGLPPKPQQPPQNTGTGPGALRGILGQGQSTGIPRGGMRGGRGGQGPSQMNQPIPQNLGPNNFGPGQAPRGGSNLPRGPNRGRGQGRGMQQQMPGNQPNNQFGPGRNSPTGGRGMNPEARQFSPGTAGQKRGREDAGEGMNVGNGSKRARGGTGGAGGV